MNSIVAEKGNCRELNDQIDKIKSEYMKEYDKLKSEYIAEYAGKNTALQYIVTLNDHISKLEKGWSVGVPAPVVGTELVVGEEVGVEKKGKREKKRKNPDSNSKSGGSKKRARKQEIIGRSKEMFELVGRLIGEWEKRGIEDNYSESEKVIMGLVQENYSIDQSTGVGGILNKRQRKISSSSSSDVNTVAKLVQVPSAAVPESSESNPKFIVSGKYYTSCYG